MDIRSKPETLVDSKRVYIALGFFVLSFGFLLSRLWYLQILKGKDFGIASERNRAREITKPAPRGVIYDRHGELLLANRPFFDLVIIPQYLQNKSATLGIVSELFKIPVETIEKRLEEARGIPYFVPIRIKRNLALHEVALVESNKFFLPGVDVDTAPRRDYTRAESAHLFGYLGEVTPKELELLNASSRDYQYRVGSIIGKQGIEKKYENHLRGVEGKDFLQVDALGRLQSDNLLDFGLYQKQPGRRGYDLELTIDAEVQRAAMEAFRGKNGAVVAIASKTGEILAYVSNPNFELSMYQDGLTSEDWQSLQANPFKPLLDKVTGGAYPPGSTFKIITGLAALEEGVSNTQRTFTCNGVFTLGNGRWRCWKKEGHGVVNLRRALELSCDIYFYQVGNLLGVDKIAKWSKLFGLGEKSGIDLNMELPGIVPSTEWKLRSRGMPWASGDTINVSIGQGYNLMTPLQIVNMFSALGSGGYLYRPYLLRKVLDDKGTTVLDEKPQLIRKIEMKPFALAEVKAGLFDVVHSASGTGKKSRVEGFTVAGKTGTAQTAALRKAKEQEDVAVQQRDHAWFAAYSPSEDPEIAVTVLSENDPGGGGSNAAPVAQKVIEAYWKKRFPEKFLAKETPIPLSAKSSPRAEAEVLPANEQSSDATNETNSQQNSPPSSGVLTAPANSDGFQNPSNVRESD
jgi:penicillin-binding protein 2